MPRRSSQAAARTRARYISQLLVPACWLTDIILAEPPCDARKSKSKSSYCNFVIIIISFRLDLNTEASQTGGELLCIKVSDRAPSQRIVCVCWEDDEDEEPGRGGGPGGREAQLSHGGEC